MSLFSPEDFSMAPGMVIRDKSFDIFRIALMTVFRRSPRLELENSVRYIVGLHVVDVVRSNASPPSLRQTCPLHDPKPLGYE